MKIFWLIVFSAGAAVMVFYFWLTFIGIPGGPREEMAAVESAKPTKLTIFRRGLEVIYRRAKIAAYYQWASLYETVKSKIEKSRSLNVKPPSRNFIPENMEPLQYNQLP